MNSTRTTTKILLVDDLKENLLALEGLLRRDDIQIFEARSGVEALGLLITHDFALALIDVQMPVMSGFELAELMRGTKKTKNIPIIFVSATATDRSFSFKGYQSGAIDFLLKPLDSYAVKSKVTIFIELYRQKMEIKTQFDRITELHESLTQAKIMAEKANSSKTRFLANMSHEIRTPLSAILGYSELMANVNQSKADTAYCAKGIQRNIEQLTELIDEILDISKVEAGKLDVERIPFNLVPELAEIFAALQERANERRLALSIKFDGDIPKIIRSCPRRLRQILLNIVGNALKFTAEGHVRVTIRLAPAARDTVHPRLQFIVKDSGCGLSSEQQERLFQPFSQADSSVTRKYGGTGLGLMLARNLAKALGGDLVLTESIPDQGSTFTFSLDTGTLNEVEMLKNIKLEDETKPIESVKDLSAGVPRLADVRVLLAEDSPDNQILLRRFLEADGAIVTSALNGQEALDLASDGLHDLILMDMQMPVLDGYEATRLLRARGCQAPIVALTANAMQGERETCISAGCNEYLSKPVKASALVMTIAKFTTELLPKPSRLPLFFRANVPASHEAIQLDPLSSRLQ